MNKKKGLTAEKHIAADRFAVKFFALFCAAAVTVLAAPQNAGKGAAGKAFAARASAAEIKNESINAETLKSETIKAETVRAETVKTGEKRRDAEPSKTSAGIVSKGAGRKTSSGKKASSVSGDFSGAKKAIIKAYKKLAVSVDVSRYHLSYTKEYSSLRDMMRAVLTHTPAIFYATDSYTVSRNAATNMIVKIGLDYNPEYSTSSGKPDVSKIKRDRKRINNIMNSALDNISPSMDDAEKALVLHDYIVSNTAYIDSEKEKLRHSAAGVFLKKRANCTGYSLSYKWLLKKAGIKSVIVDGDAIRHTWNKVNINGRWYNVDTTWDDPLDENKDYDQYGVVLHDFFLNSDAKAKNDGHRNYDTKKYPADTEYDDAFWNGIDSGIYYDSGKWLYCTSRGIVQRTGFFKGNSKVIYNAFADKLVRHSDNIYYYIDKRYNAIYMYDSSSNSAKSIWKTENYYSEDYAVTQIKTSGAYLYYRVSYGTSFKSGKLLLKSDGTVSR